MLQSQCDHSNNATSHEIPMEIGKKTTPPSINGHFRILKWKVWILKWEVSYIRIYIYIYIIKAHVRALQSLEKSHRTTALPRLAACSRDPQALRFASWRLRADEAFVRSIGKAEIGRAWEIPRFEWRKFGSVTTAWWFGIWILCGIYWECHHPNWLIFFRGVDTTNQIRISCPQMAPSFGWSEWQFAQIHQEKNGHVLKIANFFMKIIGKSSISSIQ